MLHSLGKRSEADIFFFLFFLERTKCKNCYGMISFLLLRFRRICPFGGNLLIDLASSVHVWGAADDPDGECRGRCDLVI